MRKAVWTKTICLAAVRQYEENCSSNNHKPSVANYEAWSKEQADRPSFGTLVRVLGRWNALRLEAAEDPATIIINPPHKPKIWTEDLCFPALRQYEADCQEAGETVTRDGYQEWSKRHDNVPSIGPIEDLGNWNDVRLRAAIDPDNVKLNQVRKTSLNP